MIPEAVIDGETGILVNPGNSVELSEAILKVIKNRDLREKMCRNGREFVLKNVRWEECGKKNGRFIATSFGKFTQKQTIKLLKKFIRSYASKLKTDTYTLQNPSQNVI